MSILQNGKNHRRHYRRPRAEAWYNTSDHGAAPTDIRGAEATENDSEVGDDRMGKIVYRPVAAAGFDTVILKSTVRRGYSPAVIDGRGTAIRCAISAIERRFGPGSVMPLGQAAGREVVRAISTGCVGLDLAIGIGGLPRGRITEVFGEEGSGKTTLALHVIAEAQKSGGTAALIDVEHALDPCYAGRIGVDIGRLLVSQPDCGEDALGIVEILLQNGAVDAIAVDSVAALTPRAEIEGRTGDDHPGRQAQLMSQSLRKLCGLAARSHAVVLFTNQIREKICAASGCQERSTGGHALKFYAAIRLEVRRAEILHRDGAVIGIRSRVKVVKNKVAPPYRFADCDILFETGISRLRAVLDAAVDNGVVRQLGGSYRFGDLRLGSGRDAALRALEAQPALLDEIERAVRDHHTKRPA
ncbi:MAG: recombinase RecA [Capsulimonadaceae bacterium]